MELHLKQSPRGTRVLVYEHAERHRKICNTLISIAEVFGAREVQLPILDMTTLYHDAGDEALRHIYSFREPSTGKSVCLRPEGTITCRLLADTLWKDRRDVQIFYVTKCWRNERPQLGRYHEFTQFGVEILNPRVVEAQPEIFIELGTRMIAAFTKRFTVIHSIRRPFAYYNGPGFEILCEQLGDLGDRRAEARTVVCAGGPYKQGYGFAIDVERVMLLLENGNGK